MGAPTLVSFPLPILTALLCGVVAVLIGRLDLGVARAGAMFSTLFALCALEALLVGLRFGYGVTTLIPLQRVLPLFLGPVLYLGFAAMAVGPRAFRRQLLFHLAAPVLAMALFWWLVDDLRLLDWLISASYLLYIAALFLLWRKGADALAFARIDVTRRMSTWVLRAIGLLVFILLLDSAIALDFAINRGANATRLISYGTIPLILLLLAVLIALPAMLVRTRPTATPAGQFGAEDARMEETTRALMEKDRLYLDPDLTVQRLARRLHVPARALSGAINRTRGMNVSQYVNSFRLAHAADLLVQSDDSVSKIAERSGFLTRSNFYREFQRVHGCSPTEFRQAGGSVHSARPGAT
ncbi:MAG: helix-turn-helix transcriptional regulator [Alphaproteobacteria bacterium]|nr:helix-turn-helix transcriptional regulator [Alphaproteobacteria bacterium]